jgi:hypothetical protein
LKTRAALARTTNGERFDVNPYDMMIPHMSGIDVFEATTSTVIHKLSP